MYDSVISQPHDFLLPIIVYIDKTGTDQFQRYSHEPIMVTTAILNKNARRDTENNWFCLGQIPQTKTLIKTCDSKPKKPKQQIQHDCIRAILGSFRAAQKQNPVLPLRLGNKIKYVRLHLPIAFVMGDGLNADQLSTRLINYTQTPRISRFCFCHWNTCDSSTHKCHIVCYPMIEALHTGTFSG